MCGVREIVSIRGGRPACDIRALPPDAHRGPERRGHICSIRTQLSLGHRPAPDHRSRRGKYNHRWCRPTAVHHPFNGEIYNFLRTSRGARGTPACASDAFGHRIRTWPPGIHGMRECCLRFTDLALVDLRHTRLDLFLAATVSASSRCSHAVPGSLRLRLQQRALFEASGRPAIDIDVARGLCLDAFRRRRGSPHPPPRDKAAAGPAIVRLAEKGAGFRRWWARSITCRAFQKNPPERVELLAILFSGCRRDPHAQRRPIGLPVRRLR